jgi:outer membrane protein assembly factor BamE (lipoprotein component of BamABCDE complex)
MTELKWVKGMESPNKGGRPKGVKADALARLKRWSARRGTEKELDRIYDKLGTPRDQLEMHKAVWYYVYAKPSAGSISPEELEAVYEKQVKLEQENNNLKQELNAIQKAS